MRKTVEIEEALETRLITKFLEITRGKYNFSFEEALEAILEYLEQVEYDLMVTEDELNWHRPCPWR
jgi:hypothetical protein